MQHFFQQSSVLPRHVVWHDAVLHEGGQLGGKTPLTCDIHLNFGLDFLPIH